MPAAEKISLFLRHLNERDLPDGELYRLKAEAFDASASEAREWGDRRLAEECGEAARVARVARARRG